MSTIFIKYAGNDITHTYEGVDRNFIQVLFHFEIYALIFSFIIILKMRKLFKLTLLSALLIVLAYSQAAAIPIDGLGTVLPQFSSSSAAPYRAFNDLMKQSLPLVPYQLTSWGSIGRCWSCNLTYINELKHQYPANLAKFVWAVA